MPGTNTGDNAGLGVVALALGEADSPDGGTGEEARSDEGLHHTGEITLITPASVGHNISFDVAAPREYKLFLVQVGGFPYDPYESCDPYVSLGVCVFVPGSCLPGVLLL